MNYIKGLLAACIILASHTIARADLFATSFTCTVTQSNDSLFAIGETFLNSFYFDSGTVSPDGLFYAGNGYNNGGVGQQVFGQITAAGSNGVTHSYFQDDIGQVFGSALSAGNSVTVLNGVVTNFYWDAQNGFAGTHYTFNTFAFSSTPGIMVKGTVAFSQLTAVPDAAPTALLLGLSLLGLFLLPGKRGAMILR